jgi:membrane peptidoglycan carboxypeptidase
LRTAYATGDAVIHFTQPMTIASSRGSLATMAARFALLGNLRLPGNGTSPAKRDNSRKMGRALLIAAFIGAIVAGLALPASALAAWAVDHAGVAWNDLPEALRNPARIEASYLYANDGKTLLTTFYDQNRRDVRLSDVAPQMRQAVVAAEDSRFYEHGGVDLKGVLRAAVANGASGGVEQGASTLTMQYVRNVLKNDPSLTQAERDAATDVSTVRKIREMRYAVTIEQRLSKDDILERYLNIAYFGHGAYGIYAAAHTYFSKDPSQLTLAESALLAGILQSPEADNPVNGDKNRALQRRTYVLQAMAHSGDITAGQAATADAEKLVVKPSASPNDCAAATTSTGYFCDYFRRWWLSQSAFGATQDDRLQELRTGGYRIVTSLDPHVQATAQSQVLTIYGYAGQRVAPMAVVEPGTGRVLAMAVNRHYGSGSKPGYDMNQLVAGGDDLYGYQAGSTFKLFTMIAALEEGKTLDTGFNSPDKYVSSFPSSDPGNCDGHYCPSNASASMSGYRDMWTGFGRSVNTYFVQLEEQVGVAKAVDVAKRLGIQFRNNVDKANAADPADWGSFTLGTSMTTPLDLASAYATLGAEGRYCAPTPIASITDGSGRKLPDGQPSCTQAISPDVARAAADAARCPVGQQSAYGRCDGSTAGAVNGIMGGRAVAGKTGSSDHNATESFVAVTPQMAAASIAANPKTPTDYVGSAVQRDVIAAVARTLAQSLAGQPDERFTAPPQAYAFGTGYAGRGDSQWPQWMDWGDGNGRKPRQRPSTNPSPTAIPGPTNGGGGNHKRP